MLSQTQLGDYVTRLLSMFCDLGHGPTEGCFEGLVGNGAAGLADSLQPLQRPLFRSAIVEPLP